MPELSMRRLISLLSSSALIATLLVVAAVPAVSAATCTPTGFYRDGINLTAAQIGGDVTGPLNATGCHIGVYYGPGTSANVTNADISGATYYGVLATKASVNVTNSQVHDIGEVPFNGAQHGIALYFASVRSGTADDGLGNYLQPTCDTGTTTGTISGNGVRLYQKGGITANCVGTNVKVTNNTVTGLGTVDFIAQNGIQVGYGAKATVTGNTVTANQYTGVGGTSSAGILVVGGTCYSLPLTVGLTISKNTVTSNDVGVWLFNCGAGTTKTNNSVKLNTISNGAVTNTTGWSATCGYQVGIADAGHRDLIVNNTISGTGYTPQNPDCSGTPPAYLRFIDLDSSARGVPSNK
jgi:parallel beta-helix repeat protein